MPEIDEPVEMDALREAMSMLKLCMDKNAALRAQNEALRASADALADDVAEAIDYAKTMASRLDTALTNYRSIPNEGGYTP